MNNHDAKYPIFGRVSRFCYNYTNTHLCSVPGSSLRARASCRRAQRLQIRNTKAQSPIPRSHARRCRPISVSLSYTNLLSSSLSPDIHVRRVNCCSHSPWLRSMLDLRCASSVQCHVRLGPRRHPHWTHTHTIIAQNSNCTRQIWAIVGAIEGVAFLAAGRGSCAVVQSQSCSTIGSAVALRPLRATTAPTTKSATSKAKMAVGA